MLQRLCLATATALIAASVAIPAVAQSWPTRPLRILVGFAPGGTSDVSARMVGDIVSKELG